MATPKLIRHLLNQTLMAYPQHTAKLPHDVVAGMADVWQEHLADLDDALLSAAVKNHIERSQWLPSIAEIRSSAVSLMRQASPAAQIAGEAWGDVKRAIASVGYYGLPDFDNPATAAVVRRMGWRDICLDDGPEGVIRAQFERMYNAEIERMEGKVQQSAAVRQFVEMMTVSQAPALPEGDVKALVARTAATMRR
jgi:hypothetical protein